MRFTEKVAIVTGAAGGIGEAYARALAAEGATVVVADLNETDGQSVAESIGGYFVRVDVSDEASAKNLAETVVEKSGKVHYLINNAAIYGEMKFDFLTTVNWDYYKKFMGVNMDGALNICRQLIPHMPKGSAIINQSSTAATTYSSFYGVAKAGINSLTQQLAVELGGRGIRINAIAPGPIDTAATRNATPDAAVKDIVSKLPISRMGTPEDLTGMALFLLSPEASWITGKVFNVDGGQVF